MQRLVETISEEVEAAIIYGITMNNMNRHEYQKIKKDIDEVFKNSLSKDVHLHVFGSRLMGLACKDSDLDVFVDLDSNYFGKNVVNATEWIIASKECFLQDSNFNVFDPSETKLDPILVVQHVGTGWNINIEFTNGLNVENSLFTKKMFDMQPEAKKLAYYIFFWFKGCEIEVKRFFLKVLLIFYMQSYYYLPSVKKIQDGLPARLVENCNTAYDKHANIQTYGCHLMTSYKQHLRSFFAFYANFDFKRNLICPYLAKTISKSGSRNLGSLKDLDKHINSTQKKWTKEDPMIVLAPLNSSQSLTQNFSQLTAFQENCRQAAGYH